MQHVMSGWNENDTQILGNNTLMHNFRTHAWNKTIQGELIAHQHARSMSCFSVRLSLFVPIALPIKTFVLIWGCPFSELIMRLKGSCSDWYQIAVFLQQEFHQLSSVISGACIRKVYPDSWCV